MFCEFCEQGFLVRLGDCASGDRQIVIFTSEISQRHDFFRRERVHHSCDAVALDQSIEVFFCEFSDGDRVLIF